METDVKFDGGRTMVIVIIRRFDSVVLFWLLSLLWALFSLVFSLFPSCVFVVPPCVFVVPPCVFVSSSCVFVASPCAFVFANLLWFSFVVLIVEICLLPIFLFVFLAIS